MTRNVAATLGFAIFAAIIAAATIATAIISNGAFAESSDEYTTYLSTPAAAWLPPLSSRGWLTGPGPKAGHAPLLLSA